MGKSLIVSLIAVSILLFGCALLPGQDQASADNSSSQSQGQNQTIAPANTSEFEPILVGNDSDSHGCIGSAGYAWCEAKGKCLRSWEENCTAPLPPNPVVEQAKQYCGKDAKAYVCGGNIRVTGSTPGGVSTIYSNGIAFVCPPGAPESMSPKCKELLFGSNCVEQEVC